MIAGEDPEEFDALRAQLWTEFEPRLGMESVLVDRLAARAWRLRRIPVFEAALITLRREAHAEEKRRWGGDSEDTAEDEERCNLDTGRALIRDGGEMLLRVSRYEASQMNAFHRDLRELLFLQDRWRRRAEERKQTVEVLPPHTNDREAA
jgi:hypothetical protein